ncbi:HD-domain/PDEase-like protein [Cucurbitaria berberidis CBS 394.84]|uniref:Phosphodiesterase n=1 Tax=Cucurbitaria berberidis CBS 394.84 TaxID=1168544 RepID=A0A9P4G9A2_9PLEO|nr:HD-domain/PDEase-like protein [Cucurbitaria berberidis CBS 394.84]KAF1841503.1 HD-domain/PDEase-like protein [Cucurbitaria berberidis CBS 394.84]
MEHGACNVIYIDRRANDEHVRKETLSKSLVARTGTQNAGQSYFVLGKTSPPEVTDNVEAILSMCNEVHICGSGRSCLSKIASILESTKANVPTFVIIDIPYDQEQRLKRLSREPRTPSPTSSLLRRTDTTEPDDIYAMQLLTHISSEISSRNFSKLVVPVVMLTGLDHDAFSTTLSSPGLHPSHPLTDTLRLTRYLDAGAVDVLASPLSKERIRGLIIHAYRLQKEWTREEASFLTTKRNRKLSWVGVDDTKPYAYLREAMVSNLMTGICNPETVGESLEPRDFDLDDDRRAVVEERVGTWAFSAHDCTDDELVYGALVMLRHALQMPELEKWAMTEDELIVFLLASRTAYNEFVKYHNFRHVVDVLQALFHFLVRIGTLPPYPSNSTSTSTPKSPIAELLKPFDALTLLISAIGHDVGHPGVNNAFLVALNAPLAQLYNDRSVLESFHCAAYSQILRRYWPAAFADAAMRKLMINNILATDMGLHFKYMSDLGSLQQKVAHENGVLDAWSVKVQEEQKDLTCGLLIKCADICNVARKFETAAQWANILTDEFSNQGLMEEELQMPSCLFGGPPVRDDIIKLGESQIGFMNIFARPLFEAVTDILPAMRFAVDEILANKAVWEKKIDEERQKNRKRPDLTLGVLAPSYSVDPTPSPHSRGPAKPGASVPALPTVQKPTPTTSPGEADRRGSTGSSQTALSGSQRTSIVVDKGSRRSSATGVPGQRALVSRENQSSSRRGSGDPSLTAILVTHTPNASDSTPIVSSPCPEDRSRGDRKDTLTSSSTKKKDKDLGRPVTAPSQARRSHVVNLYPVPQPSSQSHSSQVDLSHPTNGNFDGSKMPQWDNNKMSGDSNATRSDASRNSSWWRQMSSRRGTRDVRNGDADGRASHKEGMLDTFPSNTDSTTTSPTSTSPGRKTTSGKIKNFFKRKPSGSHKEHDKQLSSYGSSSQLRTPQTSDPGRSLNSDD